MMRPYAVGPLQNPLSRLRNTDLQLEDFNEELLTGEEFLAAQAEGNSRIFIPLISNQ